jgi:acyl carrier protein
MDSIVAELRCYIFQNVLVGEDPARLRDDDPLLDSGVLDSFAIVQLVSFIEERFGLKLAADEITEERFATIAALSSFLAERTGQARR